MHVKGAGWVAALALLWGSPVLADAPGGACFDGARLYDDVRTYAAFGFKNTATQEDIATSLWMEARLRAEGLEIERETFTARQFFRDETKLTLADGAAIEAFPLWFPKATAVEGVRAPLQWSDTGRVRAGAIAVVPFDDVWGGGTTVRGMRQAATAAAEAGAAGLIVVARSLPGEYAATNMFADSALPAVIVGGRDEARLRAAAQAGGHAHLVLTGRVEPNARAYQITAVRRGGPQRIYVSTPTSGHTAAGGERGPGIAYLLALACWLKDRPRDYTYVFVVPAGHELQGAGFRDYMARRPPEKSEVKAWLHLGGGIAVYDWEGRNETFKLKSTQSTITRLFANEPWLVGILRESFAGLPYDPQQSDQGAGYLGLVVRMGYPGWGFEGSHSYHHLPGDLAQTTGPEILEPAGRAIVRAIEAIERARP